MTNNLTLNLGLAWALVTPITEAQDRQANFDFNSTCGSPPGCNYLIPGQNSDSRPASNWTRPLSSPALDSLGSLLDRQSTAVRAGYAIFHDSSWNQGAQGLWENPPFFGSSNADGFAFGGCPSATTPSGQPSFCSTAAGVPLSTGRTLSSDSLSFLRLPIPAHSGETFSRRTSTSSRE